MPQSLPCTFIKGKFDFFSFIKGLSGQKDGSSEKQSITNFCPMDLHDKDNITFAWQKGVIVESDMREEQESMMITNKNN